MSSEVKRFVVDMQGRGEECVLASDYAALEAECERLRGEISDLHTTMMAAAVEIQEHWAAHCDEEGYGPANLMHRLERGIASQYGYTAQALVQLKAERDALAAELAAIKGREPVEVVGWLGGNGLHAERHDATGAPFPLMTVAQHQRILAASVPAGCKVVPVELLERAVYNMELAEMDGPTYRELRALLASAEGVKDE